jgi:hypothetical protein
MVEEESGGFFYLAAMAVELASGDIALHQGGS